MLEMYRDWLRRQPQKLPDPPKPTDFDQLAKRYAEWLSELYGVPFAGWWEREGDAITIHTQPMAEIEPVLKIYVECDTKSEEI